mmetsp:Transcript_25292/g.22306  ORF Transcript_25292/g.22306 Transcript_25292/m.22306 type:complete len:121 (+) Transcript_25292:1947-2309(+)
MIGIFIDEDEVVTIQDGYGVLSANTATDTDLVATSNFQADATGTSAVTLLGYELTRTTDAESLVVYFSRQGNNEDDTINYDVDYATSLSAYTLYCRAIHGTTPTATDSVYDLSTRSVSTV